MHKDGMSLLTAERQALLNDMLQWEHIRMFIGLKLDTETIPNAERMKTTMTTAKSHSPIPFFCPILQTTPRAKSLLSLLLTEIDEMYALAKSPPPNTHTSEMAKMVTHMLYLGLAVGFKWCRNYLYLFEELL